MNYKYVTSGQWYLSCDGGLPNGQLGDGYIARSPDGLVYHFNHMVTEPYSALLRPAALGVNVTLNRERNRLYPTLVTDRYGNSVTYSWSGSNLTAITSSDGRSLTVGYNGSGMISTISDGARTWSYGYSSSPNNWLTSVTLPDSSQWNYDFSPIGIGVVAYSATGNDTYDYDRSLSCNWMKTLVSNLNQHSITITHPSGATGVFGFDVKRFGRARVYYACNETVGNDERTHFPSNPARFDTWSITQKTVSGAGISTPYTWYYTYNSPVGSFADHGCDLTHSCPLTKTVDVVAPDGSRTTSTYGIEYGVSDTQLQKVEIFPSGSSTPLRTTTYQYGDTSTASGQYVFTIGMTPQWYLSDAYIAEWVRPQRYRSIVQDGVTFTNIVNAFDTYAKPISVSKSSALGSKTEISTYNNTNKWVVSQPSTMTVAGTVVSQTDYDPTYAYPTAVYQFGKKQYDLTYFTSGVLAGNVNTVTDGNGHTTTYSDYYRGIARRVDFADLNFQTAAVSPLGLITAITNEAGFTTNYGYTTDGRLQSITYPTGDRTGWNTRNFVFERAPPSDYDEYGIGEGHWRQTISTGNARTVNYFDALWRPILTRSYDAANETGTRKMVLNKYDFMGHATYASYPQRTINSIGDSPAGTSSTYDALGSIKTSVASSDLGGLTTSVAYLTGFQKQVTNPRLKVTTTSYQAFDEPSDSAPTNIAEPLSTTTAIARNVFGQPTAVTRYGSYAGPISATRSYVYDGYQRLCKTVEPESLATIIDYDNAGNIAWRAAGQNLTGTATCDQSSVAANQRTSYAYDTRNRLTDTSFGDASPPIHTTYTADGLPNTTSADGSTWTYSYNHPRLLTNESLSFGGVVYNIGHGYDGNGHKSSLSYPDSSSIAYAPNALGEVTQAGLYASNVQRHANGGIASFTYGNGITHSTSQNTRGLPDTSTDTNVIDDHYVWDENANVASITNTIPGGSSSRTMSYDDRDRLIGTTFSDFAAPVTFSYDPLDNLRTYDTGARNYTSEYDAHWHMTRIRDAGDATMYSYGYVGDAGSRGNVTSRMKGSALIENFTFDQGNRLRSATGTNNLSYTYDALGRRTSLTSAAGTRHQIYNQSGQLLYETNSAAPASSTWYVYLDRHLAAKVKSVPNAGTLTTTYLHADGLGSPVGETDAIGTVLNRKQFEPYGLQLSAGEQGPGYTGHVYDADLELNYMQQRYYDPVAGRFLSVDPVSTDPNSGGNFNRYWYANNNPYKNVDPDGRVAQAVVGAVVGIVVDIAAQQIANGFGSSIDPGSVVASATLGAATAGIGAIYSAAAKAGTISVTQAVTRTAAANGLAGVTSSAVGSITSGDTPDPVNIAVAGLATMGVSALSGKLANSPAIRNEVMSAAKPNTPQGIGATIVSTTNNANGNAVGQSAGATTISAAADLSAATAQKNIEEKR